MLFVLRSGSRFFIGVMNPFQAFGPMAVWVATVKNEAENTVVINLFLLFDKFFVELIDPLDGFKGGGGPMDAPSSRSNFVSFHEIFGAK